MAESLRCSPETHNVTTLFFIYFNWRLITLQYGGGFCHTVTRISHGCTNWLCVHACGHAQSCLTLCDPMDCSPPGSSLHEILLARILEWVSMPSSRGSSRPKDWNWVSCISCIQAGSLPLSHQGSSLSSYPPPPKSLQSCLTLCDPIDGSPPGSPIPGILQARTPKTK